MTTQWVFSEIAGITERNIHILKTRFSAYSEQQMAWKPNDDTWSLNEIFAHLTAYAGFYHPVFIDKIEKTRFRTPREQFISSPLGKSAWASMKLGNAKNVKRRFNAPRLYNPTVNTELVSGNETEKLLNGQRDLLGILEKAIYINIRKAKVPIAISKIVRLRIGDALLFVAYHNERHMQQAMNLSKHAKFPKK